MITAGAIAHAWLATLAMSVAQGTLTNSDGDDFQACAGDHSPDRAFAWTAPARAPKHRAAPTSDGSTAGSKRQ